MTLRGVNERLWDTVLAIDTYQGIPARELGLPDGCHEYTAVPYEFLFPMLFSAWPLRHSALIDFGCGKGRVLRVASVMFDRVEGVEIAPALIPNAFRNTRRARNSVVHCIDAADYQIPADASVFFFSNPFSGQPLQRVLRNILTSLEEHPRPHCILAFFCLGHLSRAAAAIGVEVITDKHVERGEYSWGSLRLAVNK
jgi:SAM-dependent methyltransferase